jgi:hypothetical protein
VIGVRPLLLPGSTITPFLSGGNTPKLILLLLFRSTSPTAQDILEPLGLDDSRMVFRAPPFLVFITAEGGSSVERGVEEA